MRSFLGSLFRAVALNFFFSLVNKSSRMFHDPDFTPFQPRNKPSFRANLRNFLENLPPTAYREGFSVLPGLWPLIPKTILLTDPECIEEMLLRRAELFRRDEMTVR